ncbi:MAG: hypothetical protein ACRCSQ_09505 [Bacteroidales bacterium]
MDKRIFLSVSFFVFMLALHAQKPWYEIKSGVIVSKVNAGGVVLQQKEVFDEFGNQVVIESVMGLDEHALTTKTFYGDRFMTMVKTEVGKGIRYPRVRPRINWLELDDITEKAFNVRYLGRVKLKNYSCDLYKYTINDNGREQEVTNWVYKGVPLQYKTVNNGIVMEQEFISFEENPKLDQSIFEVPANVEIKEQTSL